MTYIPVTSSSGGRLEVGGLEVFLASTDPLYIVVTGIANFMDIYLPAANSVAAGKTFIIKDESGNNAAFGPINVRRSGSDTIDGNSIVTISTDYGSLTVYSNGSNQWLIP
jgi:hypothetical protein